MIRVFPSDWQIRGADVEPAPGAVHFRLEDRHSVRRTGMGDRYDWVVHCAAIRSPEVCAEDPRHALEINAKATGWLARVTADVGAKMAYASSHHVFNGEDPPYRESDTPAPVNVYGHSKLAGERHALSVPGALVVRLPALYSLDLDAPNNPLAELRRALSCGERVEADDQHLRYYTLTEEVAEAFAFLMKQECRGVVHASAQMGCTELEFRRAAAEAMGLDSELVVAREQAASSVRRPRDSRLDIGLYESLGGPPFTNYDEALRTLQ